MVTAQITLKAILSAYALIATAKPQHTRVKMWETGVILGAKDTWMAKVFNQEVEGSTPSGSTKNRNQI